MEAGSFEVVSAIVAAFTDWGDVIKRCRETGQLLSAINAVIIIALKNF